LHGITPVGFDPVTHLFGNQEGSDNPTDVACVHQGAIPPGTAGTGFVDKDKLRALRLQLPEQLVDVTLAGPDRAEGDDLRAIGCKLLLLSHAFDALGCKVVGLRADQFNLASQRAIEALGAKKDGVIRHHRARRDGTVRDTVIYSILATEWPDVKRHLELRLARHGSASR
jgi:hypothetical protein